MKPFSLLIAAADTLFRYLNIHAPQTDATEFAPRSWEDSYALADSIVAQLTLDEKIGIVKGVGVINSQCVGNTSPVPRLGIPSLCLNDGPAGVRPSKGVTGFPPAINAAATFSRRLIRARAVAIGEEFRGKGIHMFLGPAMDIMRNPKAGRAWESFGPDPYLNGEGAFETIMGVQSVGVMACAKHFIANNQEHWRYGLSAELDDRTLHEIYYYPFLRSIDANVSAVMCAYNRVNGTSSCHNSGLIGPDGLLQKDGFRGFVVSDWGATHDTAANNANAGLDMEQPGDWIVIGGGVFGSPITGLKTAVRRGGVTQARLNQMVSRILAPWYRLGQDLGYPPPNFDARKSDGSNSPRMDVSVRSTTHTLLSREIAAASTVLLKNNHTSERGLPLSAASAIKSIAIIGKDALMPNLNCGENNQCNDGTMTIGWGSGSNSLEFTVPPIDALRAEFSGTRTEISTSLSNNLDAALNAAADKDVAVVFVNAMSGELGVYEKVHGNAGDRNDLELWFQGSELVQKVAAVCSNTIVVVHSVGPVLMTWSSNPNISAIVFAGAPGEQTGPAIVDVLFGAVNPSGRLPFSLADNESSYGTKIVYGGGPLGAGFPTIPYTEKLLLDYRYMDANYISPRFEFGFGLSYTNFGYSALSITSSDSYKVIITFTVTNTGAVAGTEKPQLYLGYPIAAGEPPRVLRGFEEVLLAVGASQLVSMTVGERDMSVWDTPSQTWVRPKGEFTVYVGASIRDIRLSGSF